MGWGAWNRRRRGGRDRVRRGVGTGRWKGKEMMIRMNWKERKDEARIQASCSGLDLHTPFV